MSPQPNVLANPLVETLHAGAYVVWEPEGPGFYAREVMPIGADQTLVPGQVLTAAGVAIALAGAGADAAMILFDHVTTGAGGGEQVCHVRNMCARESDLTYYSGADATAKAAVKTALLAKGIVLR
jgi:hypothetical protein